MLIFLSILVMLAAGYAMVQEGAHAAFLMLCNVFLSGVVAFNFFEPLAREIEPIFADGVLAGLEDAFCLLGLFAGTLGLLRWATNALCPNHPEYHPLGNQIGAGLFGLMTGYLLAGFLACLFQTLPWRVDFMGFQHRVEPQSGTHKVRRVLPPDRVWLALMHRASDVPLSRGPGKDFDPDGDFETNYARNRRFKD
jgi:hypothetical protein